MAITLRPHLRKTAWACGLTLFVSMAAGSAALAAGHSMSIYATLAQPAGTAMGVGPIYSISKIKMDANIRNQLPAIDIAGLRFATGSSAVPASELGKIGAAAAAMREILSMRPFEVFLVEGHTDATGTNAINKLVSEARAASVTAMLMNQFGIPARNLTTAGYGEEFLLVPTNRSEPRNRRVTIRRITDLVDPLQ